VAGSPFTATLRDAMVRRLLVRGVAARSRGRSVDLPEAARTLRADESMFRGCARHPYAYPRAAGWLLMCT
jgi:hypothetical protein